MGANGSFRFRPPARKLPVRAALVEGAQARTDLSCGSEPFVSVCARAYSSLRPATLTSGPNSRFGFFFLLLVCPRILGVRAGVGAALREERRKKGTRGRLTPAPGSPGKVRDWQVLRDQPDFSLMVRGRERHAAPV